MKHSHRIINARSFLLQDELPDDVVKALEKGKFHPNIPARGIFEERHLRVNRDTVDNIVAFTDEHSIRFGTNGEQLLFLNNARNVNELRILKWRDWSGTEENNPPQFCQLGIDTKIRINTNHSIQLQTLQEESAKISPMIARLLKDNNPTRIVKTRWFKHRFHDSDGKEHLAKINIFEIIGNQTELGSFGVAEVEVGNIEGSDVETALAQLCKSTIERLPGYFGPRLIGDEQLRIEDLVVADPESVSQVVEYYRTKARESLSVVLEQVLASDMFLPPLKNNKG